LLAVHLLQRYSTQKPAIRKYKEELSKARLHQVIEYMNAHLTEKLSLQKIANAIGMNQYHFSRMFNQSTGLTPWQYVTEIQRAQAPSF
jgi:AraC family transcriptional regulator